MRINSLSISPDHDTDQTIFTGTDDGVFKTTNSGASWISQYIDISYSNIIHSVIVSPNYGSDQTVFAGTNDDGIFKTINGGEVWTPVNDGIPSYYPPLISITSLAISPDYTNDQTVFAGTNRTGIYITTNGGTTWSAVNAGLPDITNTWVTSIAISPYYANDRTVYAVILDGGIYKTTSAGADWIAVNSGIPNSWITSLAISPNYASDQTVYTGTANDGSFKTVNGGTSWSESLRYGNIFSLTITPNYSDSQTVYAGSSNNGIYRSTDEGTQWVAINDGLPPSGWYTVNSLAASPNYATDQTIYAGTVGGVWTYTVDDVPPITTANAAGYTFGEWTSSGSVSVDLSSQDGNGSGVALGFPKYCVDTIITYCYPQTTYTTAFDVICATGETCTQHVHYRADDNVGNHEIVKTSIVKQDLQAPISIASAGNYIFGYWTASSSVGVMVSANDSGSGVAPNYPKCCVDTTDTCTPDTSCGSSVTVTCSSGEICTQYLRHQALDKVGNVEDVKSSIVRQDLSAPLCSHGPVLLGLDYAPSLQAGYDSLQHDAIIMVEGIGLMR